jgi:hypothetical protein
MRRLQVPRITVDFSEVEDFEALPKDDYPAVIVKAIYREPQDQDKFPYINLEMDVTGPGEKGTFEGDPKGRKLWSILSLSPKALWRTKQVFENLDLYADEVDIDVEEGENGEMLVVDPPLVGVPVIASVSQREYEGRMQNQVDAITSPNGSGAPKKAGGRAAGPKKSSGPSRRGGKTFK